MLENEGIAIVGLDCRYPGAHTTAQYWENILALRQQFRHIPSQRLNLADYFSTDKSQPDYTYSKQAAVLQGYHFDRSKYKVSKSSFEQTDMAHWLALDVANGALRDAGFENGAGLNKERVGVIVGNSLTGEFTRANVLRLRWPYVSKVMAATLSELNYTERDIITILARAEQRFKEPFPEPDADMLAGGLSNTIAGRICNYFDFNGGGFTVDGACSSSLLAFENGCRALEQGDLDVAIVGGVDLSIDPFELIGFARNGALAAQEMEVYGTKSEGFWPGEGCGMAVLMRASEAIQRGINVYAVIKGWGISSDGNGGITRPKAATQVMAFERAYQKAGYGMDTVALFEGHGTGTTLGDQIELETITDALMRTGKKENPATLGSVKELIGHTKAAAGVAGLIKVCMALKNGIIPASRPLKSHHTLLDKHNKLLHLNQSPICWTYHEPMRASVSAMGFGGINVHIALEQAAESRKNPRPTTKLNRLVRSYRDYEVFPISHSSQEGLLQKMARLQHLAQVISRAEFTDLSTSLCHEFRRNGLWNVSIVANTPDALAKALETLIQSIQSGNCILIRPEEGIFFCVGADRQKIAFLFPGQGAPVYKDQGIFTNLVHANSANKLPLSAPTSSITDTSVAQPAIVERSLETVRLLELYGVEGDIAIGHSLGEISALSWAGALEPDEAIELARERGRTMSEYGQKNGAMLAVKSNETVLASLLTKGSVHVTGYNGTDNYVLGGHLAEVEKIQQEAFQLGLHNVRLKVSHAFHTPMMRQAADEFGQYLKTRSFKPVQRSVISTVTGQSVDNSTKITSLLFDQIEAPVRFTQAIESVKDGITFVFELGPGNTLTRSLDGYDNFHRIAMDYGGSSLNGFLSILSAAFIAGQEVLFEELSADRFYRPFNIEGWELDVLISPCEKIPSLGSAVQLVARPKEINVALASPKKEIQETAIGTEHSLSGIQTFLIQLISDKTEIPLDILSSDDKLMSQLHINSLAITEIITLVIKRFNKSQLVFSAASVLANADGNIAELSQVIFDGEFSTVAEMEKMDVSLDGLPNWTHIFRREDTTVTRPLLSIDNGPVQVLVVGISPLKAEIEKAMRPTPFQLGRVAVFVNESVQADEVLHSFVQFLNRSDVRLANLVALLNLQTDVDDQNLEPVLRTFQLEVPTATVLSLTLPTNHPDAVTLLLNELNSTTKYKEVRYDAENIRTESRVSVYFPHAGEWGHVLGPDDVVLATGGGKGITFASTRFIGQQTGAKLVIFGRSIVGQDAELTANLAQLTADGLAYCYYPVDVCDAGSVFAAVRQAEAAFGKITILLHGAGINKPKSLSLLTSSDFIDTSRVKVKGLKNVINALQMEQLKMVLGYGSIIAESGMYSNADYAWANDRLARYIDKLGQQHPHCRAFTLEWSVWAEMGMGVNLNSLTNLKQKGVWPIPVVQGLDVLRQVMTDVGLQHGRLIISGRYGNLPTLTYQRTKLPTGRFITNIRQHTPGVEIMADVPVNLQDDLYLSNHVFEGQYVFPTVMVLEGVAQLTNALTSHTGIWAFENLTIQKSIFVPQNGSNLIRFVVTRLSRSRFRAVIRSEDSNFEVICFAMDICLNDVAMPAFDTSLLQNCQPLPLSVPTKFYDDLLFHQGPFRRIQSFYKINSTESLALASTNSTDNWFGAFLSNTCILGDAGLNDAAIHCHQACRPGSSLLPSEAGRILIDPQPNDEPVYIRTIETYDDETQTIIDVYIMTESGKVRQYWTGLVLNPVSGKSFTHEWDPYLLAPYVEYNINKRFGQAIQRVQYDDCLHLIEGVQQSGMATYSRNGYILTLQKSMDTFLLDKIIMKRNHNGKPLLLSPLRLSNSDDSYTLEICETQAQHII